MSVGPKFQRARVGDAQAALKFLDFLVRFVLRQNEQNDKKTPLVVVSFFYKRYIKLTLFSTILTVVIQSVNAQSMAMPSKTIQLDYTPDKVSADWYGNTYITDKSGNIYKYDSLGNTKRNFSPPRPAEITLLEAQNSVGIFAFRESVQDYTLYDRLLSLNPVFKIDRDKVGYARAATLSSDRNLWIIDDTDLSLKKYDLQLKDVTVNTPLDLLLTPGNYEINFIREYQNLLFINNREKGILVFDNLGNYKKTLPFKTSELGFTENELYFLEGNDIRFFDLYTLKERKLKLPEGNFFSVLISQKGLVLITKDTVNFYRL